MASKLSVVNHALYLLGEPRITALTDSDERSRAVNDIFDQVRDEVLEQHGWNFATTRATLTASSTAPDHGYSTAYPLPENYIRLLSLNDEQVSSAADWAVESHLGALALLTSVAATQIKYVYRVTDPNLWSPLFRKAFSAKLANDLAVRFRVDVAKKAAAFAEYQQALAEARFIDSRQSRVERLNPRRFARARRGVDRYVAIEDP